MNVFLNIQSPYGDSSCDTLTWALIILKDILLICLIVLDY